MDEEIQAEKTCETCRYFHRHYTKGGRNWYMPLDHGHCSSPWCRHKKLTTPACHRYSAKPAPRGK